MHYFTGDPLYRDWAEEIRAAIEEHARVPFGYSSVDGVDSKKPRDRNNMESFFFAETLKYLYLIQMPSGTIDLNEMVFNTEAHPFRMSAAKTECRGGRV